VRNKNEARVSVGTSRETVADRPPGATIPCSTYRLQFQRDFTFQDAQSVVLYLCRLGICDCYASPLLRTPSESTHGYAICDYSQLNPIMGRSADFEAFSDALKRCQMGLILDTVPNHMDIQDQCNNWWMDVLENGPSSFYAGNFDIDWRPVKRELESRVLLPILGNQYGRVLESGGFRLAFEDGAFFVYHYDTKLPVAPETYPHVLALPLKHLIQTLSDSDESVQELQSILTALKHLPSRTEQDPERMIERSREKEIIKRRLAALAGTRSLVREELETTVKRFNGIVGRPRSFDLLDELLNRQVYRPAFWRVAAEEINYRRFFDVNALAAITVERP
jgi:(1->4)-alpha-D-glucan 1-alpha-D-glucosylmutase